MPILIDGEFLPESLIRAESERLALHPDFRSLPPGAERAAKLRSAAEDTAINRALVARAAARDPRPIPPADVEIELAQFLRQNGNHRVFDREVLRPQIESRLRVKRCIDDMRRKAPEPHDEQARGLFEQNRETFRAPERVHAAHIIKHSGEGLEEPEAKAGIEAALSELERGTPFSEVADRFSDCPGAGGDLGWFARGAMVQEFEDVVFAMTPGERSGIFRSALGYHIALLIEKREAGLADFEEACGKINETLRAFYEHEAIRACTMRLRSEAVIRRVNNAAAGTGGGKHDIGA